ncbi:MAG: hypothetical protein EA352_08990 [Gemmatimonadales bacterium]|nr:MAG: hypothetical protein EA352_08990 [Gemmatimonadales bacterium]
MRYPPSPSLLAQFARRSRSLARLGLPLLVFLALTTSPADGQWTETPGPGTWALQDVTVNHADGTVEEGVTLVVRDGVIQAMGVDAEVPAGARRVSWDEGTLRELPGLVDAQGNGSMDWPEASREGVSPFNPTREVQRFTPHRSAADFLADAGPDFSSQREAGVVASVILPPPGIMTGQASLVLHRVDARTPRELILQSSLGVVTAFQGAQGAYPGTLMAQQAFLRQMFEDARHYTAHSGGSGATAPRGMATGTHDADLELLNQMMDGQVRTLFRVNGAEDIRRVLALVDEYGLDVTLVGGREAGLLADELARRGIPVWLNAYLPNPDEWDPEDDEAELSPAAFRERERLLRAWQTPAQLAEAGVDFVFTSGGSGGGSNMLAGVRRAIEWGLDEEVALRALTSGPAGAFGLDHLARIEAGGAATFIVTDGPLLEEGRGIAWTFVNGQVEEGRTPRASGDEPEEGDGVDPAVAQELDGRWEGSAVAQGQSIPVTVVFRWDGTELTGEADFAEEGSESLDDIRTTEDGVTFRMASPQFQGAAMDFSATLDGDRMTGSATILIPQGQFDLDFSLERRPGGLEDVR